MIKWLAELQEFELMSQKRTSKSKKTTARKLTTKKFSPKKGKLTLNQAGAEFAQKSRSLETWLRKEIVPSIEHVYALIEAGNRNYKQGNLPIAEYNEAEVMHTMMAIYQKFETWVAADSTEELLAA